MTDPGPQKQPSSLSNVQAQVSRTNRDIRLAAGEAHMMCRDCGAKLYSFDGNEDADRSCPYMKNGVCEP